MTFQVRFFVLSYPKKEKNIKISIKTTNTKTKILKTLKTNGEVHMRNIFIVNPKAGQGKGNEKFTEKIKETAAKCGYEAEIYTTAGIGDAEILTAQLAAERENGEKLRIYACGGDGTLNEVLNGVLTSGAENLAVGVLPIGTGNDFCRNFPDAGDFMDIEAQLSASEYKCDAVKYSGIIAGRQQTRYCCNMLNIGFDCNVVDKAAKMKTYPMISGSMAYMMSVFAVFAKKDGADLKIEVDGQTVHDGPLLLTAAANGSFYGGGVKGAPTACLDDGLMDINVVTDMKRLKFLKLFPYYAKGTHLSVEGIDSVLYTAQVKRLAITPNSGSMRLCADGEITDAERIEAEMVQGAFNFLVPKKQGE